MPAYPWLDTTVVDADVMPTKLTALRRIGVPYTDAEIKDATEAVKGKTEMEALIAYLQVLGTAGPSAPPVKTAAAQ
jgi:cytochrome c oxidase cbb3-type subunit 2